MRASGSQQSGPSSRDEPAESQHMLGAVHGKCVRHLGACEVAARGTEAALPDTCTAVGGLGGMSDHQHILLCNVCIYVHVSSLCGLQPSAWSGQVILS